ncbi:MAG: menaquinone biosynthesis decarboxylase [Bacteroidales bacterium]|jgi:4-hydroxy-3-polyprenylbenzoate decarboxylase|nr:menaquinone biosynthesis decarboxylase [Bacteroidales bacterium]
MTHLSLNSFVNLLEKNNELIRVKEFVNPNLQITEIVDRFSKSKDGGKAILFENTKTNFPLLINAFGSNKRMCLALGVNNLDDISQDIEQIVKNFSSKDLNFFDKLKLLPKISKISTYIPKLVKDKADCQEIINFKPDLEKLPVMKCWPNDGGKFITLPSVHTINPLNESRNIGMYRMQILDDTTTGMHWHKHKGGAQHFAEYKKAAKRMPVSVTLGGDPAYTYSATAPLPDNLDEYLLAGFIRKKKVKLVKCITNDIEVPNDVDIVIEGYIDPTEDFVLEGPFGDHTGFYSLADYYPKFHVTCITHKKNAIYPATIVGIPPMEDAWIAKATERIFFTPIQISVVPEIVDINFPIEGVAHNITLIKIKKTYPGQALKVMNALWGAGQMMFNKILIVVDDNLNIDLQNYSELSQYILRNLNISTDISFSKGPLDILDHSSQKFSFGSKLGIDMTTKFQEEKNLKSDLQKDIQPNKIIFDQIRNNFREIVRINISDKNSEIVIVSVNKNKTQLNKLRTKLIESAYLQFAKVIIFVDWNVDVYDFSMCTWIVAGNIDPIRDCVITKKENSKFTQIWFDGTRKTVLNDNFERNWPNVIVSDDKTIKEVDDIIENINFGKFIVSPSIKYKKLLFGSGVVANE